MTSRRDRKKAMAQATHAILATSHEVIQADGNVVLHSTEDVVQTQAPVELKEMPYGDQLLSIMDGANFVHVIPTPADLSWLLKTTALGYRREEDQVSVIQLEGNLIDLCKYTVDGEELGRCIFTVSAIGLTWLRKVLV